MAFAQFTNIDQVLRRYNLTQVKAEFVRPPATFPPPSPYTLDELAFTLTRVPFERSTAFARQAVIYPILRDVSKHYAADLTLFGGEPVETDDGPSGEFDYVICRRSRHGPFTPDEPILVVGLAGGWANPLAGMMAARMLDPAGGRVLYGLSTTGRAWSFGRLDGNTFTEDPRAITVTDTNELYAALHYVFAACRDQLPPTPRRRMTAADTLQLLADTFAVAVHPAGHDPHAVVPAGKLVEVCTFLRDDPRLRFDLLNDLTFVDYLEPDAKKAPKAGIDPHVEIVYHLSSFSRPGARLTLKVVLPRWADDVPGDLPEVPTVSRLWPTADWHEREAFDLGGVRFAGHPDPRRILLADDWVGHPLRKDYEFPVEYHGIRCR